MSAPFTDEEMMVLAQLSYKDPYIKAKGNNLSLYDMLSYEKDYLIAYLGEQNRDLVERLLKKTQGGDYYVVASTNDRHGSGFAALAISGPDKDTVTVAARGTEGFSMDNENSIRDVMSDAQLGFEGETNQQKAMNEFMLQFTDYDSIYLTGHSLGGNLAVSGAVCFPYPDKIKGVVTFNCPGQNAEYIATHGIRIARIEDKIKNYQNESDRVSDINIPIGSVIVIEAVDEGDFLSGYTSNHLLSGIDMSNGGFTQVEGNKKDENHSYIQAGLFLVTTYIDYKDWEWGVYLLVGVIVFVKATYDMVAKVVEWVDKHFNAGYKYSQANPFIQVNTDALKDYAERVREVNRKLDDLDDRISRLYKRIGIGDDWELQKADMKIGYSRKLNKCANYLSDTATEFAEAESGIKKNI